MEYLILAVVVLVIFAIFGGVFIWIASIACSLLAALLKPAATEPTVPLQLLLLLLLPL